MLADGSADFAKTIGLEADLTKFGLGMRSKRYAMLVDDGVVKVVKVEELPPHHGVSSAETMCSLVDRAF
jgi:glutaredoxin/glutathione-dependent peroxiredoxin